MEKVSPHDYGNGAKLMEHSYIGNDYVSAVECLLYSDGATKGRWAEQRIVWAGDYADGEENTEENLYSILENKPGLKNLIKVSPDNFIYLINLDAKEYVDKSKLPVLKNSDDWFIHPLPLLTAEGNGRGGGDFHGDKEYVGIWSRSRIALVKEIPDNYNELIPNFYENK